MKKYLSLLLAVLMLLSALVLMVACAEETPGNNDNNPGGPSTPGTPNTPEGPSIPGKDEPRKPIDYLPSEKFGTEGEPQQFNILNWTCGTDTSAGTQWMPWEEADVLALDGDRLGEAVFNRNAAIEDMYNVEITSEVGAFGVTPDYNAALVSDAQNSEGRYQLYICRTLNIIFLLRNEYLQDMNEYEQYLHTDEPWWVKDSVTSYTVGDGLYAACTEMLLRDKGATATMFYNKILKKDYEDLPDFYSLVNNMEWTMEAMIEAADLVDSDVGGGVGMDSIDDIYGMTGADDPIYYLYNSFGNKWAHINEDGMVQYDFSQDEDGKTVTTLQKIYEEIMYADWYFNDFVNSGMLEEGQYLFADGHALFYSGMMKHSVTRMSNMQQEYGILPHPMYNELQEDYSALVWMHHDSFVAIPKAAVVTTGADLSAVILEALSWESYYSVSPVFYKEILYARAAKDTPDVDMVKRILNSRSYDPGLYYDGGSHLHGSEGYLRLTGSRSSDVVSIFASFGDAALEYMDKINNLVRGEDYE